MESIDGVEVPQDGDEALSVLGELGLAVPGVNTEAEVGGEDEGQAEEPQQAQPQHDEREAADRRERYRTRQQQRNTELDALRNQLAQNNALLQQALGQRQQQAQQQEPRRYEGVPEELQQYMSDLLAQERAAQQQQLAPLINRLQAEDQRMRQEIAMRQQQERFHQMDADLINDVAAYAAENAGFDERYGAYEAAMHDAFQAVGVPQHLANDLVKGNAYGMALMARQLGVSVGYLADEFCKAMLNRAGNGRQTQQAPRRAPQPSRETRVARQLAPPAPGPSRRSGGGETVGDIVASGQFGRAEAAKIFAAAKGNKARFNSLITQAAVAADKL